MLTGIILTTLTLAGAPEDQVRCAELAFSRSAEERNLQAFETFLDPDARFTGGGVLRGKEAVVEGWRPFFEPGGPAIEWAPDSVEVLTSGDLALSQGPYRMQVVDEAGNKTTVTGRFSSVWRRSEDGSWKVIFDGGTPGHPATDEDPFGTLGCDRETVCGSD